jgi:hypothetical protein
VRGGIDLSLLAPEWDSLLIPALPLIKGMLVVTAFPALLVLPVLLVLRTIPAKPLLPALLLHGGVSPETALTAILLPSSERYTSNTGNAGRTPISIPYLNTVFAVNASDGLVGNLSAPGGRPKASNAGITGNSVDVFVSARCASNASITGTSGVVE